MLTPERMSDLHAAYANDREPGAFERVLAQVWNEAVDLAARRCEAMKADLPPVQTEVWQLAANTCRALKAGESGK